MLFDYQKDMFTLGILHLRLGVKMVVKGLMMFIILLDIGAKLEKKNIFIMCE